MAVTEKPAVLRAARIRDPSWPVACEVLDLETRVQGGVLSVEHVMSLLSTIWTLIHNQNIAEILVIISIIAAML